MLALEYNETVSLTTMGAEQCLADPRDEVVGTDVTGFVDDDELVAAKPSHDIGGACEPHQPSRGLAQHEVAGVVSITYR